MEKYSQKYHKLTIRDLIVGIVAESVRNAFRPKWLKAAFLLVLILTLISEVFVLLGFVKAMNDGYLYSGTVFETSLNLVFSIIGLLVAVIVFSVQFIQAKFDLQELQFHPVSNFYLFLTPFLLVLCILFNFAAIYLEWVFPFTLLSVILSGTVILLVADIVSFLIYYLDISNILKELSDETIRFIRKEKTFKEHPLIGKMGYSKDFISL